MIPRLEAEFGFEAIFVPKMTSHFAMDNPLKYLQFSDIFLILIPFFTKKRPLSQAENEFGFFLSILHLKYWRYFDMCSIT